MSIHQNPEQRLKVVIMDGSMGGYICSKLEDDPMVKQCWSATALLNEKHYDFVVKAHKDHIEAGAQTITTNSYGVQPNYFRKAFGQDYESKMLDCTQLASRLAVQARNQSSNPDVRVWGCIPPICESHRPDLFLDFLKVEGEEFVKSSYTKLAKAALKGGADALILQNLNCWEEAQIALKACHQLDTQIILTVEAGIRDCKVQPHPESAAGIIRNILNFKLSKAQLKVTGFGCSAPEHIVQCLEAIENEEDIQKELKERGISIAAYANVNNRTELFLKGYSRDMKYKHIDLRADLAENKYTGYAEFCAIFVEHGANYVGGCCGCGPEGIATMIERLAQETVEDKTQNQNQKLVPTVVQ